MVSDEQSLMPPVVVRYFEQQKRGNPQPREACIFRIPPDVYSGNPVANAPSLVALGPYPVLAEPSDDKREFIVTLDDKIMYHEEFLRRYDLNIDEILSTIRDVEAEIQDSYSDKCHIYDSNALMEIMVRDSSFVIEYFRPIYTEVSKGINMVMKPWDDVTLKKDLILFDNQLHLSSMKPTFLNIFSCLIFLSRSGAVGSEHGHNDVETFNTKYNTICVGLKSFMEEKRNKESFKDKCWKTPKRRVVSIARFAAAVLFLYGVSCTMRK